MKSIIIVLLIALSGYVGCSKKENSVNDQTIGAQFWKYDLSEYELIDSDVGYGLGGRWISQKFKANSQAVSKPVISKRIADSLKNEGWNSSTVPNNMKMQSKVWETGPSDIYFVRPRVSTEPKNWSYLEQRFHFSDDGKILCVYAAVHW